MDPLKVEYLLKKKGITRDDLMKTQNWSSSTYYRKLSGDVAWTIQECNRLIGLGVTITEIIDYFFDPNLVISDTEL